MHTEPAHQDADYETEVVSYQAVLIDIVPDLVNEKHCW